MLRRRCRPFPASLLRRLRQADQRHLMRLPVGGYDEHRRDVLGEIGEARLVHGRLIVPDRPSCPLSFRIHGSGNTLDLIRPNVVVVTADDSLWVDSELEDVVGAGRVSCDNRKHAQRQPLAVRGRRGRLSCAGDCGCLLCVLLWRADHVAIHVDGIGLNYHIAAVVIRDRRCRHPKRAGKSAITRLRIERR